MDDLTEHTDYQFDHKAKVYESGQVRLALLDKNGNILKVSPILVMKSRQLLGSVRGVFRYDAKTDTFVVETDIYGLSILLYAILCLCGLIFTCLVEHLTAIPFGLRFAYGKSIVWVNIISQLLMHLCYILLYSVVFWRYTFSVILLELLVYSGEFLIYRKIMKHISLAKCLGYTVAANTASLLLGLLLGLHLIS